MLKKFRWTRALLVAASLCACKPQNDAPAAAVAATSVEAPVPVKPVSLDNTEELQVRDEAAGREYPIWVSLPASYADEPQRRYPVLYVTDALYSFPLLRSIRNLVGQKGVNIEDFILVGLPPQAGLTSKQSRSRDYTPTSPQRRNADDYSAGEYGGAAHYRDFLAAQVFPQVEARYRIDGARRAFAGHSLGGLFGSYVLLTRPEMFQTYILSSPSLWFDGHVTEKFEAEYASGHHELKARVLLSAGQYETIKPGPRYFHNNDMVGDNARFAAKLKSRGYPGLQVETGVIEGEDHFTVYPTVITRALLKAFPGKGPYSSG